jgi:hypothetical protein
MEKYLIFLYLNTSFWAVTRRSLEIKKKELNRNM